MAVTIFYFMLYITILFMQKEKRMLYKVFESIMSLAPSDNSNMGGNPACAGPQLKRLQAACALSSTACSRGSSRSPVWCPFTDLD